MFWVFFGFLGQFQNTLITVSEIPYLYYDLWNNKADIIILSFNNEWVLLLHWCQRQASIASSLRGDERTYTVPAKPCAQPREATRHFEVELWQHWYGGFYKAKYFLWCLEGTNISSAYCWTYRFSQLSTKSLLQSLETYPTLLLIPVPLQTLAWDAALIKMFTS